MLSGQVAKQIFEKARLPNEVLGRIWNLSDTQGRGALDATEFTIAMHLLASYKGGVMRGVPSTLPPGLYEAASRRGPVRASTGPRPGSSSFPQAPAIAPQFSGFGGRPQSPVVRQQAGTPLSAQGTGDGWLVTPQDKQRFDQVFAGLDTSNRGFITGEQAVEFFGNARLPEDVLASIWDLADINSEGQLNRDEFAVAMYLIRQQRGSKEGRGNLPPTLPAALVPPSMRRQQAPPSQPTAPAFENAPVTQPRSAADDLFGLDAFSSPGATGPPLNTQVPQSTGGSTGGPFSTPKSFSPAANSSPTTTFKPFVPSSSFGQSLAPQPTTGSANQQVRAFPSQTQASDDLLGDADPEVGQKLTSETTELANLSNQVANLSKQMTEVHGDRAKAEQELAQSTQEKRDFESRLSQLRTAYEQEVKEVKALQERLTASRNDTKRLKQDMAMIDGSHQDLRNQHQQVASAMQVDQQENTSLKEKIRQLNVEVNELKPQVEKIRSEARQQKGLVAINRKQLATNEAERDRLQAEMAAAQKELDDARQEAQQTSNQVEQTSREIEEAKNAPPPAALASPPQVASPAPSTSSNPFFRRTATIPSEAPFSPSSTAREAHPENHSNFDSIFGPSFTTQPSATPPPVSFRTETPAQSRVEATDTPQARSETFDTPTTSSSGVPEVVEPPEPPQSRQITSAALPFRAPLDRNDSVSSSVRVAPPASRISPADTPESATPSASTASPGSQRDALAPTSGPKEKSKTELSPVDQATPTAASKEHDPMETMFGQATNQRMADIPGAFPGADISRTSTPQPEPQHTAVAAGAGAATLAAGAGLAAAAVHEHETADPASMEAEASDESVPANRGSDNFDQYFDGQSHTRSESQKASDFDNAFADMRTPPATNGDATSSKREFPPIHEVDDDDSDDSSEAPMAFDDNFNSPPRPPRISEAPTAVTSKSQAASAVPDYLQPSRPALQTAPSAGSSLPGVEAQSSPPAYDASSRQSDPSHFPPEFNGLLPRREDPTSPPPAAESIASPAAATSNPQPSYGPEQERSERPSEIEQQAFQQKRFTSHDFDSAFAGMNMQAAPVEDDDDEEDDLDTSHNAHRDFDPTFDSPPQSRPIGPSASGPTPSIYSSVTNGPAPMQTSNHAPAPASNTFENFPPPEGPPPNRQGGSQSAAAAGEAPHDWDAMFAGLDTPAPASNVGDFGTSNGPLQASSPSMTSKATAALSSAAAPPAASPSPRPQRPTPGRALSVGTEHDDPILKRLTSMGWNREESLSALEKFDYNIDKVNVY